MINEGALYMFELRLTEFIHSMLNKHFNVLGNTVVVFSHNIIVLCQRYKLLVYFIVYSFIMSNVETTFVLISF